jgi:hypothetical protein
MSKSKFLIQIDNRIIRSNEIDHVSFFLYCKLMQHYRYFGGKKDVLEFDHKQLQYFCGIKTNKKLKECLNILHKMKLIKNQITELPRNEPLKIEIHTYFDKKKHEEKNKLRIEKGKKPKEFSEFYYTQLPCELLDLKILKLIGYTGVRLMYYYRSYVGNFTTSNQFAFPSFKTIKKEIGLSDDTIDKYNKILKKNKLLKIEKHKLKHNNEYELDEFGLPVGVFTKYNNHYYILEENVVSMIN